MINQIEFNYKIGTKSERETVNILLSHNIPFRSCLQTVKFWKTQML